MKEIKDYGQLKKIAIILRTIIQIVFVAFIILGALLIIAEIIIAIIPEKNFILTNVFNGDLTFNIKGLVEFDVASRLGEDLAFKGTLLLLLPTILFYILFYIINFSQVSSILKSVLSDQPFDENNSRSLFVMGSTFVAGSFILEIMGNALFVQIATIIGASGINISFTPNLTMLFTGILLFILSGVFKYGNYLQNEYDSTI